MTAIEKEIAQDVLDKGTVVKKENYGSITSYEVELDGSRYIITKDGDEIIYFLRRIA